MSCCSDELASARKLLGTGDATVCEQAIVPDAVEAFGQDVHEEAADELMGVELDRLPAIGSIEPIVLPAERDATVVGGD